MKRIALGLACCCVAFGAVALAGCKKKTPALTEVSGLAAVPSSAQVVIGVDAARVADSPLVGRAVDQLFLRDSDVGARWDKLREACKLDLKQIKQVLLAIGSPSGPGGDGKVGTGPVLMVVTGQLAETQLSTCVRSMVGQGGGELTAKAVAGRTLYEAKDGNRVVFFAFGRPDTVVLGSSEAYVTEAIGAGKKVLDNPEMKKLLDLADVRAPIWGAGQVDERVRAGLVRVTNGQLSAGPAAIVLGADPSAGIKLDVAAVMANVADAKALESFAKSNLGLLGMAAQAKNLGKLVDKVGIESQGTLVRFKLALDLDEVNQLLSVLDGGGPAAQDSPPATGSGSSTP